MQFLILVTFIGIAGAASVPQRTNDADAPIVKSESHVGPESFGYAYETGNGISADAQGELKQFKESAAVVHRGAYRYTAPDGTNVVFNYVADENGYQPQSDLLPVGPPIPDAILRSLEYNAAHAPKN